MPVTTPKVTANIPTPEEQHAKAKKHYTEEQERATQEKARQMQEDMDRQQGKSKKEK